MSIQPVVIAPLDDRQPRVLPAPGFSLPSSSKQATAELEERQHCRTGHLGIQHLGPTPVTFSLCQLPPPVVSDTCMTTLTVSAVFIAVVLKRYCHPAACGWCSSSSQCPSCAGPDQPRHYAEPPWTSFGKPGAISRRLVWAIVPPLSHTRNQTKQKLHLREALRTPPSASISIILAVQSEPTLNRLFFTNSASQQARCPSRLCCWPWPA